MAASLSPEEKQKMLMILTLLSQGQAGRNTLAALQPLLQMWEQKQADDKAKKEKKRAELNAIGSQVGAIGGQLGGMYLMGQALAPAAAAPAVATPTLLGAKTVSLGGTGAGAGTGGMSAGAIGGVAALGAVGLNQLWEGGMKDILRGRGNRGDWINTGLMVGTGGLGGLPNLALRLMGKRSIGTMMTTGKSDAQLMRDDFRGVLKEKGIVDNDYNVTLANGQKFNLGLDGKTKYQNADGKTTRNAWDVDLNDPLSQYAASKIDPHIRKMYGAGDPKNGLNPEQYTGMIVNAVRSGAKTEAEIDANIASVLGTKPFEGQAPVRPTAATPPPANQPAPPAPTVTAAPTPAPPAAPNIMARPSIQDVLKPPAPAPMPAPAPQVATEPATRPPAPVQGSFTTAPTPPPVVPIPPQAKMGPQGLLSFADQIKQRGSDMDLNGMLNMLKNLQQQNGAKS